MDEHNLFATLQQVFAQLDVNGDGRVCLAEFRPIYERLNPSCTGSDVKKRFMSIDTDSSGTISADEMAAYYGFNAETGELNGGALTDAQIIELMHLSSLTSQHTNERRAKKAAAKPEGGATDDALVSELVQSAQARLIIAGPGANVGPRRGSITMLRLAGGAVLEKTIKIHAKTEKEHEFLDSCALGDFARARALLAQGVEACIAGERGEGPMHKVARIGTSEAISMARQLLEAGVDVNLQDLEGKTAAHYAAEYAHADMLAWLFAMGADPEAISIEGWSVLHQAVFKADRPCIELLVNMYRPKIDINAQDIHARTPLHIAAYRADEDVLRLLYARGRVALAQLRAPHRWRARVRARSRRAHSARGARRARHARPAQDQPRGQPDDRGRDEPAPGQPGGQVGPARLARPAHQRGRSALARARRAARLQRLVPQRQGHAAGRLARRDPARAADAGAAAGGARAEEGRGCRRRKWARRARGCLRVQSRVRSPREKFVSLRASRRSRLSDATESVTCIGICTPPAQIRVHHVMPQSLSAACSTSTKLSVT